MKFFIKNALAIQVMVLIAAYSWIHGGTRADLLLPVIPWLTLMVVEVAIFFPQCKSTETLSDARDRVKRHLRRDPLLYLSIALTVLLVLPMFNETGIPELNRVTGEWINKPAPHKWLPSCVSAVDHASLLLWFIPTLVSLLAVRHGLLKRGKRVLLEMICWNGAALAVFGFVQQFTGATSVYWGTAKFSDFFSTFGYPNIAGAFFTLHFALSAGMWFAHVTETKIGPAVTESLRELPEEKPLAAQQRMLLPAALNFAAALTTLSRAAIMLSLAILLVLSIYMVVGVWQNSERGTKVKMFATLQAVVLFVALAMTVFAPSGMKNELKTISWQAVVSRVTGAEQYHTRVANEIFKDYKLFGAGGWSYGFLQMQYMTPQELKHIQVVGGVNVHNDTMQFLAEQGVLGFGLMVLCAWTLVIPLLVAMFKRYRESRASRQPVPWPRWVYCHSPVCIVALVGPIATVVHSFADLPFRDPAVLLVWALSFVCALGYIPNPKGHHHHE